MAEDTLRDKIEEIAQEPARASGDEGSYASHPLRDLIQADEHVRRRAAKKKGFGALSHHKISYPGTP
jgi:adenylate cyclase class IV